MPAHVFVDESKHCCYLVAAAALDPAGLAEARKAIQQFIMPRQRRVHFAKEGNPRRDKFLGVINGLGITATIYDASQYRREKEARPACLRRLVADLAIMKAERLVLEIDDSVAQADKRLLREEVKRVGLAACLRYELLRAHEECLLAVPDAIAWCWARGGEWRDKVKDLVTHVHQVHESPDP